MGRVVLSTIAATIGALAAWVIMEPTKLMPNYDTSIPFLYSAIIGIVCGGFMGLLLGVVESISGISQLDKRKAIIAGALFGAGGGLLGLYFGNAVYGAVNVIAGRHDVAPKLGTLSIVLWAIGRSFGWAMIGGFIGFSQGIATGSPRKTINGAVGGLIGGGIGGLTFELLALPNYMALWAGRGGGVAVPGLLQPSMIRMLSFGITGASIGFFLGLVGELTKVAWLMKVLGRNEGKEYQIYKPSTVIGRSELVDVPVFGDPEISERHAMIRSAGGKFVLDSLDKRSPAVVNGQRVVSAELRDGDQIKLGSTDFIFGTKQRLKTSRPAEVIQDTGAVADFAPVSQTVQNQGPTVMVQGPTVMSPSAQIGGARLVGVSGPYAGAVFSLVSDAVSVGRDSGATVSLANDNTASRNHANIERVAGIWQIRDAGSSNGTFVNGNRTTQAALNTGDTVKIGETVFRFET